MADEKEVKIELIKEKCRKDLKFLCVNVLFYDWWDDNIHTPLASFVKTSGRQKLILIPRGHLKSSIVTVGYTIQRLLINPNIRILITNAVWDKARMFLTQITESLSSSALPSLFGPFKGKGRWTLDEITIAQKKLNTKRGPSIATAGVEKSLTGTHYDLIIHDDLVDRENTSTKEQKEKVLKFYKDSLSLLDPGGEMIVIGTRWATDDLYGHLIANDLHSINGRELSTAEERTNWDSILCE
jgi:hypothetical protein